MTCVQKRFTTPEIVFESKDFMAPMNLSGLFPNRNAILITCKRTKEEGYDYLIFAIEPGRFDDYNSKGYTEGFIVKLSSKNTSNYAADLPYSAITIASQIKSGLFEYLESESYMEEGRMFIRKSAEVYRYGNLINSTENPIAVLYTALDTLRHDYIACLGEEHRHGEFTELIRHLKVVEGLAYISEIIKDRETKARIDTLEDKVKQDSIPLRAD